MTSSTCILYSPYDAQMIVLHWPPLHLPYSTMDVEKVGSADANNPRPDGPPELWLDKTGLCEGLCLKVPGVAFAGRMHAVRDSPCESFAKLLALNPAQLVPSIHPLSYTSSGRHPPEPQNIIAVKNLKYT